MTFSFHHCAPLVATTHTEYALWLQKISFFFVCLLLSTLSHIGLASSITVRRRLLVALSVFDSYSTFVCAAATLLPSKCVCVCLNVMNFRQRCAASTICMRIDEHLYKCQASENYNLYYFEFIIRASFPEVKTQYALAMTCSEHH